MRVFTCCADKNIRFLRGFLKSLFFVLTPESPEKGHIDIQYFIFIYKYIFLFSGWLFFRMVKADIQLCLFG